MISRETCRILAGTYRFNPAVVALLAILTELANYFADIRRLLAQVKVDDAASLRRAGYRRTCSCVRLWVIPKFRRGNSGCRRLERKLIDVDSGALNDINEVCRVSGM